MITLPESVLGKKPRAPSCMTARASSGCAVPEMTTSLIAGKALSVSAMLACPAMPGIARSSSTMS